MLAAAAFMILMSLGMLGWLPHWLVPRLPASWSVAAARMRTGRTPFVVGLLNGLMPCGPLQAMQIYALATGSVWLGALSMFLFAAGTVPLMLGAGVAFSALRGRFNRVITRASAVLVLLLAIVMLTNSAGFFGIVLPGADQPSARSTTTRGESQPAAKPATIQAGNGSTYRLAGQFTVANLKDGYQEVSVDVGSSDYPPVIVQKGIPVRFNLWAAASSLNGCNGSVIIPSEQIQLDLRPGDNIAEFTPKATGNIAFSCWMGMIRSKIRVVDDLSAYGENPADSATGGAEPDPAATSDPTVVSDAALPAETAGSGISCCQ
jgi:hypothetical protein